MKGLDKLKGKLKKALPRKAHQSSTIDKQPLGQPRILKSRASSRTTSSTRSRTQFIIGLDFGTSYTKVAISGFENKYTVQLLPNTHLLPTRFFIDSVGNCTLEQSDAVDKIEVSKLKLIENKARTQDLAIMAAYCALVLKSARCWMLSKESSRLVNYEIDWLLNVGLPTESSQNSRLTTLYRKIIKSAWKFSNINDGFSLRELESYLSFGDVPDKLSSHEFSGLHEDCLSLFPEFVGQIQSYIRSPQRQNFAHLLIDVGGGTVDVAVFRVVENEGEYSYPIYGKSVKTIGAEVLNKKRESMGVKAADKWMEGEFKALIGDVITNIPSGSYVEDIHCIFIGGGASLPLYKKALDDFKDKQKSYYPLRITGLNQPYEMVDTKLSERDFHRVSVAYGLTFEPDDLGFLELGVVEKKTSYKKSENSYLLDAS
ncbi:putative ParM/StbA family protein [Vibrio crassostreae]|nr:putative ParM/StbA family protein [Vibrio crassostreae]